MYYIFVYTYPQKATDIYTQQGYDVEDKSSNAYYFMIKSEKKSHSGEVLCLCE